MRIDVQRTAKQVPAAAWSPGGEPGALYGSADWFTLAETLGTRLRYLVACQIDSGAALGVLPVLLEPPRPGGSYDLGALLLGPALAPQGALDEAYLVAGSWNSNLALLPAVHSRQVEVRRAVLSALLCAFARMAQEKHVPGLCLPFLLPEAAGELADLVGESGYVLRTAPTTWIHLQGPSFATLLATFARKQRKNMQRELRLFEAGSGQVYLEAPGDSLDELADLVVQNRVRHAGAAEREKVREMLYAQLEVFGERVLTLGTRRQGHLVAAITLLASHGGLYARSFGCAYADRGMRPMEYFTLGYYAPFRYALEHGLHWYHAGPQAYEAKVRRGLELVPLWTVFLPHDPPTARQLAMVQRWNNAVDAQWQNWFSATTGHPLPASWHALNVRAR
jgi:hypothetical protein